MYIPDSQVCVPEARSSTQPRAAGTLLTRARELSCGGVVGRRKGRCPARMGHGELGGSAGQRVNDDKGRRTHLLQQRGEADAQRSGATARS